MIVCHCCNCRDSELISAIKDDTVSSLEDIQEEKIACTGCKGCEPLIQEIVDAFQEKDLDQEKDSES